MNPAFSVIFLTTLIGAAQGLFLVVYGMEWAGWATPGFWAAGGVLALVLSVAGLIASFFHLGRPERAWRTATMWRTSWLSREVIALPLFMGLVGLWTLAHLMGWGHTLAVGAAAALASLVLFVCTAMIYASIRFLQEWASPYTLVNYALLGLASGSTLATAMAGVAAPEVVPPLAGLTLLFTVAGGISRSLSLLRNAKLVPRSTLQTAIGIRHPQITQRSQGLMGGSFNTREFFHHKTPGALRGVKWVFLLAAFVLPVALVLLGWSMASAGLLVLAFVVQYLGLLAERWFFFAQARHPQNLYYQTVA